MRRLILRNITTLAIFALAGCAQRERIGGDLTLVTPNSWNPDGHPGTSLHYQGREAWPNVYVGSGKAYHEGIFVFSAPVPEPRMGTDGTVRYDYSTSPQLFAIRGAGPPVILSQRVLSDTLKSRKIYHLWQLMPTESGVQAEFEYWPDQDHEARMTHRVAWTDIQNWVQEAESSAPIQATPLGTYRLLSPKRSTER